MKPLLVIGLGNPLMGDDGIGPRIVEELRGNPRLPECAEVMDGGTDLLQCASQIEGRSRVVLIDAIHDGSEPGTVSVFDESFAGLDESQHHAHGLSAVEAVGLLKLIAPVPFRLIGISIASAGVDRELSPTLRAAMPTILERVVRELAVG